MGGLVPPSTKLTPWSTYFHPSPETIVVAPPFTPPKPGVLYDDDGVLLLLLLLLLPNVLPVDQTTPFTLHDLITSMHIPHGSIVVNTHVSPTFPDMTLGPPLPALLPVSGSPPPPPTTIDDSFSRARISE